MARQLLRARSAETSHGAPAGVTPVLGDPTASRSSPASMRPVLGHGREASRRTPACRGRSGTHYVCSRCISRFRRRAPPPACRPRAKATREPIAGRGPPSAAADKDPGLPIRPPATPTRAQSQRPYWPLTLSRRFDPPPTSGGVGRQLAATVLSVGAGQPGEAPSPPPSLAFAHGRHALVELQGGQATPHRPGSGTGPSSSFACLAWSTCECAAGAGGSTPLCGRQMNRGSRQQRARVIILSGDLYSLPRRFRRLVPSLYLNEGHEKSCPAG